MFLSKTWTAVCAALAVVSSAVLVVMCKNPAWGIVPGLVAIACVTLMYVDAMRSGKGPADSDQAAKLITAVLDGEKPDLSGLDPALKEALADVSERIEGLSMEITELSPSDDLTSLAKENVFNNVLWREYNRSDRYKEPMSVVLAEVDQYERIVEKHGAGEGDRLLKHVASILLQIVRETDLAARYGQERFAIIMPQTAEKGALEFAERLRKAVEEGRLDINGGSTAISVAIGVASVPGEGIRTAPDLVDKAAKALNDAKALKNAKTS